MSFDPVRWEHEQLLLWDAEGTFQASVEQNRKTDGPTRHFVFQEGPPTANGRPGLHHVLARSVKDAVCRWKTMQGYVVERKAGWDCHGLPVERYVEETLGLHTLAQVQEYGVAKFNRLCEKSVWKFENEWERLTRRMGYWLDMEHRYATLDQEYMESEWWALKQLWDKELLQRRCKVLPFSPQTGCTYSKRDVSEGKRNVTDLTCFVRFPLLPQQDGEKPDETSLLAWTSTPWTLPANVLLAVNQSLDYVFVKVLSTKSESEEEEHFELEKGYYKEGEVLVFAKDRMEELQAHAPAGHMLKVVKQVAGSELLGMRYRPPLRTAGSSGDGLWEVVHADFVTGTAGTGVVHVAPMYGEDDHALCEQLSLGFHRSECQHVVGLDGCFKDNVPLPLCGLDVTKPTTQTAVVALLQKSGLLQRAHMMTHEYPYCWRNTSHRLLYYAMDSWFVTMGAPDVHERMQELNASPEVRFSPETLKHGRFGGWLRDSKDWCLSRKRTWGCPLPVWECRPEMGGCGRQHCVGSRAELESVLVDPTQVDMAKTDLHATQVDALALRCEMCGNESGAMVREPYVLDCWFDSGCAPFAQRHYPFAFGPEDSDNPTQPEGYNGSVEQAADFVAEGQDQCRGWFYSLLCLSSTLFDRPAYKHCLSLGLLLDKDGQKMSKSKGNTVDPWAHFEEEGSDALRWYLLGMCAPWADRRFDETKVRTSNQKFFRVLYNVSKWWKERQNEFPLGVFENCNSVALDNKGYGVLDRWVLSRLAGLVEGCNHHFESDNFHLAVGDLEDFVNEDLSKTYLRLSRALFRRTTEVDVRALQKRQDCLGTMRTVLVYLCRLVAPLAPFFVDRLHRCLTTETSDVGSGLSVHLAPWPKTEEFVGLRDPQAESSVGLLRSLVQAGNVLHEKGDRPGRLPLALGHCGAYPQTGEASENEYASDRALLSDELCFFLAFELNVSSVVVVKQDELNSLLSQVRRASLSPNVGRLCSRFKGETDKVLGALRLSMVGSAEKAVAGVLDPPSADADSAETPNSGANKSKNQLRREKKALAKRNRKAGVASSAEKLTGPMVDVAVKELELGHSLFVESSNGDRYELSPSDLRVSHEVLPGWLVSVQTFNNKGEPPLTTGLVLDLSVGVKQVSEYLTKEVTHFVHRLRKSMEKESLASGGGLLGQVMLCVVVAQTGQTENSSPACLNEEDWRLLLLDTNADKSSSLVQDPGADLLEECESAVVTGKMERLTVKEFRECPGFTVYVSCFEAEESE